MACFLPARIILLAGLAAAPMPAAAAAPHYPETVKLDAKPTGKETAIVRAVLAKSFGKEWPDFEKSAGRPVSFTVGHADLNGDGRPDLLVYLADFQFGYCGSHGCSGYAILATPAGHAAKPIDLAVFYGTVTVLPAARHGMHDLRYDDSQYVFHWDGAQYR
jgi:hypothetical protein